VSQTSRDGPADPHAACLPAALRELYAELDAAIAARGPVCQASGRCCRFKEYGHTLFLSRAEADYLLQADWPAYAYDENLCPFQVEGLCQARERRPLGCRVYYCDPAYHGQAGPLSEEFIVRLKALHEAHGLAWDYRPLHDYVRERQESG